MQKNSYQHAQHALAENKQCEKKTVSAVLVNLRKIFSL